MPIQKVLLVDRDEAARSVGKAVLERAGLEVLTESDLAAGFARAEASKPDVLLLDSRLASSLPEFLARLHGGKTTARVVVILTGEEGPTDSPGTAGTIAKPFVAESLAGQVRSFYESGRIDYQLARLDDIGGADFVCEMIGLFLEHSPPRLQAARAGLQAGDLAAVARAVHPLKSSAGNLGADTVQSLSEHIEQQAMAGVGDALPALLIQLEDAYRQVQARLEAIRTARGSNAD
jgi:HPt (histidine-containing phosphotransfer) domain-containing protein